MSVTELQKKISRLTPVKRRAVAKYITFIERLDSPARRQRTTRIMREMDAGVKYTRAQVEAILAQNPPAGE
jgi:predicted transcriptional regulator of viral defense system